MNIHKPKGREAVISRNVPTHSDQITVTTPTTNIYSIFYFNSFGENGQPPNKNQTLQYCKTINV